MDDQEEKKSWDTLYEKYPDMFSNRHKSPMESCMSWGCEIGMGWYDILEAICWKIKQHEENITWHTEFKQKTDPDYKSDYVPVKFDQVKEKFGGLRIYYSGGDDCINGMVAMAATMSYKICESCGERGKPNKGGWIVTLCDKCRNKTYDQTPLNNGG
jgi:hypothetical protein